MIPKFRAWDKTIKIMQTVEDINCEVGAITIEECVCFKLDNFVLMQSTGLLDKNGKEIFEGDIVDYQVPNQEMCGLYEVRRSSSGEWRIDNETYGRSLYIAGSQHCKIIGNIYENPELLEVTDD